MPWRHEGLRRRDYLLLTGAALVVFLTVMAMQPVPGYMDAAYYYATGIQLAQGNGFTEPFLWNYLDHPLSLPHPSHTYWHPLASLVGALGMWLTGSRDYLSARLVPLVLALMLPSMVAVLSWRLFKKRSLAITSGLLAVFCGYYLPFLLTTDNYASGMVIGALYFLALEGITPRRALLPGILAGIMYLARADGLLWLPLTLAAVFLLTMGNKQGLPPYRRVSQALVAGLVALIGFAFITSPWFGRNLNLFGRLTPPGSMYVLWMSDYNQIFSFTPQVHTSSSWMTLGWKAIISARLEALGQNLGTAVMAQGNIFLTPLVLIACWRFRRLPVVIFACAGWSLLLIGESILFPFASVRGGFFHGGAGFQPLWFVLAPAGLEVLGRAAARWIPTLRLQVLLNGGLVVMMVILSGMLVKMRVLDTGWNEGEYRYLRAEAILVEQGVSPGAIVMVANPPAYNAMTGRKAIVLPAGDVEVLLAAAEKFGCEYVVLEKNRLQASFANIYWHPQEEPRFIEIGGFEDVKILLITPPQD